MDAELKSLRIDRSKKRAPDGSSRTLRRVIIATLLLIGLAALGFAYARLNAAPEVETVRVRARPDATAGEGGIVLNATGYIIAAHKIEVASKVIGKVAWIGVEKGDVVKQGQALVRLEDDEYRARVTEAQGALSTLRARLRASENGSRPEEVARAGAELTQMQADLENSRTSLNRTRTLVREGLQPQQALDDAQARFDAQAARVASFQKSYEIVRLGPREEEIDALRGQIRQAEGTLSYAQIQLENTIIRAPVSGAILERNVEKGEFVTTGFVGDRGAKGYVVSLADLNDLQVELDISQNDFARLGQHQPATVTTDAFPDRKYQGVIAEISPEANRQKATVQVRVKILNPDAYLRPEMNATVAFRSAEKSEADKPAQTAAGSRLTVPASAVRDGAVFVVIAGKAVRRKVQTAGTTPQGVPIKEGLIGGEDVIVNPPANLKDGQKVRSKS